MRFIRERESRREGSSEGRRRRGEKRRDGKRIGVYKLLDNFKRL